MANYTDITILLDRSGSMQSIKAAMESGMHEFINGHKEVPSTRISLVQFDGNDPFEEVYVEQPIWDTPTFIMTPRGSTPLLDALCKAIDKTGKRLAAKVKADRPDKVLFLVITDGEENASKEYTRVDVRSRILRQKNTYNWEFSYLGANQDAYKEAQSFGIDLGKTMNFAFAAEGTKNAMRALTTTSVNYASGVSGQSMSNYTVADCNNAMATDDDTKGTSGKA